MNIIFLDIDGVFNCQLYYNSKQFSDYKSAKKTLRKNVKSNNIDRMEYYSGQLCKDRIRWFNALCKDVNAKIVISSTWRLNKTIEQLQEIFNHNGGKFEVIGKTDHLGYERGVEISKWLRDNCFNLTGVHYYDFHNYAIIDDDSDMLLDQQQHFFQTDAYSGLTPNTCYKVKRFFTNKEFDI